MDNDFPVNVDEIISVLGTAEVVVFRFAAVRKRLLLDFRSSGSMGPLVALVQPARSAEERFQSLKELRPGMPMPERIIAIHWPKLVDRIESSGVWRAIEARVRDASVSETERMLGDALRELRQLERREIQNAIRGEGFQTIWERPS